MLTQRRQQLSQIASRRLAALGQGADLAQHGVGGDEVRGRRLGCIAEARESAGTGVREGLEQAVHPGQRRGRVAKVGEHGRRRVAEAAQLRHRRAQLAQEAGEASEALFEVFAALGRRLGGDRRLVDEAGDALALARERAEDRVGVDRELHELAVLAGERRQDLVRFPQRRVRALDDLRELVAAGGEAGAEIVEDQAEAVRIGLFHDVVDEVEVDRLAVLLERQQILPLAGLSLGDLLEGRGRRRRRSPRLGELALDELLTDQRLRPDQAGGVGPEILKSGIGDRHHDHGLAGLGIAVGPGGLVGAGDVDLLDDADLCPGDPDLLVGNDEGGVVEDRADLVHPLLTAGGGAGDEHGDDRGGADERCEDPSHGPGGTSSGSHWPARSPPSRNG